MANTLDYYYHQHQSMDNLRHSRHTFHSIQYIDLSIVNSTFMSSLNVRRVVNVVDNSINETPPNREKEKLNDWLYHFVTIATSSFLLLLLNGIGRVEIDSEDFKLQLSNESTNVDVENRFDVNEYYFFIILWNTTDEIELHRNVFS